MRSRDPLSDPERLIRRVYAYVAYRIGDGPDAEDVTAEAMERAVRYSDSYDPARGDATGWVIGIARRVLFSRAAALPTAALDESAQTSDGFEEGSVRRVTLAAAVARLGERDRELVALRYGADLSAREIAQVLEMKTNAVEVALHRTVARLRAELASDPAVKPTAIVQPVPD
jgi:RNA polymerase sigma factor (sigma-70 family)